MSEVRFSRILACLVAAAAVLLGVIRVALGQKATEKTLTALAMPCGIIWCLLTCVTVMAVAGRQRRPAGLMLAIWLVYTLSGNGMVSGRLAQSLESRFMQIRPLSEQPFDVVVVLGGGASTGGNSRQQGNGSGDRLILAAQLYHQGLTKRLICTGKRILSMNSLGFDPSDQSTDVLVRLGVPREHIERLGGRTTSEEMVFLGERFAETDQRVGLLTSAWHLPRALRLAHRWGFSPHPLPADFMCGPPAQATAGQLIVSCIPQADALMGTTRVAKEYLGMLVGR